MPKAAARLRVSTACARGAECPLGRGLGERAGCGRGVMCRPSIWGATDAPQSEAASLKASTGVGRGGGGWEAEGPGLEWGVACGNMVWVVDGGGAGDEAGQGVNPRCIARGAL